MSLNVIDSKGTPISENEIKTELVIRETELVKVENNITIENKLKNKNIDLVKILLELTGSEEKINELKSKISVNLDKSITDLIKLLLGKSPDTLKEISKCINDIISDNVLDSNDIPKIVLLLTKLYKTNLKEIFSTNNYKLSDLFTS